MDELTAADLATLAGGRLVGDPAAAVGPQVVVDSRLAGPGALFVALPGERVDGHDYAAAAVARGAAAILGTRELDVPVPQVVVTDSLAGLTALATGVVARAKATGLKVVGITGSSGKTSTKDLAAAVLAASGPVVAPVGSFNNELGVPLTASGVDVSTRFLVSEMGARAIGNIADLCAITPPDVGIVVNVGHAHLGEFGSVEAIAQTKGELVEALPASGWAVLNDEDLRVSAMAGRTPARIARFATTAPPEAGDLRVWARDIAADARQRHRFTLASDAGSAPVALQVSGGHQVGNALAAAAAGLVLGLDVATVAEALSAAVPASRWRMELTERPDGLLVVNDAYNANPDSMRAALQALAGLRRPGGRLVAVLGDMLELGEDAARAHAETGALAGGLGVDRVVALGRFAPELAAGARAHGAVATVVDDKEQAVRLVAAEASPADVVLVKASRGLALESVAAQLVAGTGQDGVVAS